MKYSLNQEAKNNDNKVDSQSARVLIKNILFTIIIAIMFMAGFYSLFLASSSAGVNQDFTADHLSRTAAPSDDEKIEMAFGQFIDKEFIFAILDTSILGTDSYLELSARSAAQVLADSGLNASVRILYPDDNDFNKIALQNDISRFPAILAVKKDGGIIQITEDYSKDYLLFAYNSIWGKKSDCSDNKSAVY